jgi:polyisoprenoid-binding protein YceI
MSTTAIARALPTGTWRFDPVHSSIGFEVNYMTGAFRGSFRDVDARLEDDKLTGSARVDSIDVKDENLAAHLQSPDFFDAAQHPELRFESTEITRGGNELAVHGTLTVKGVTRPVVLNGSIVDPVVDPHEQERLGLKLETTIDRTEFGIDWNMPLPSGDPSLANEVRLVAELYLTKEA